jgi:hypothetical protein
MINTKEIFEKYSQEYFGKNVMMYLEFTEALGEIISLPLEAPVSREFCGNCTYLSVTEEEQNSKKKDEIHFCNLFKQRVLHFDKHPNLPRLPECKIIGKS